MLEGTAEHKEGYLYVEPWLTINSVERERLDKARLEAKIKTQQDIEKRIESLQNQVEYMAQFYDKYKGMRPEYKKIPC